MKKIFVIAIFLAVIGILCAVFLIHPEKETDDSNEMPWTVGDQAEAQTAETETTKKQETDAISVFTSFVDGTLRESCTLLNEEETYTADQLENAVYGLYMYDIDTDGTEEMTVVRTGQDGVFLDVYECESGKAVHADSLELVLDRANNVTFSQDLSAFSHMAARMTIYPKGADRYLCLTVEQQDMNGTYNAYTIVGEYAKQKLTTRKSFRLRRAPAGVTLTCLDDQTLLYVSGAVSNEAVATPDSPDSTDTTGESETTVKMTLPSAAKYGELDTAFRTEYEKLGLAAPETKMENGTLAQYKVSAVPSEQHIFECSMENGALRILENGFLQSFLIRH